MWIRDQQAVDRLYDAFEQHVFDAYVIVKVLDVNGIRDAAAGVCMN